MASELARLDADDRVCERCGKPANAWLVFQSMAKTSKVWLCHTCLCQTRAIFTQYIVKGADVSIHQKS